MKGVFINEAFDTAIKHYIKSSDNHDNANEESFLDNVLKMLAFIYGEVDIVNPYIIHNEKAFKDNICRYGLDTTKYNEFVRDFYNYYLTSSDNNSSSNKLNQYFVQVQKDIIDMFFAKKRNYFVSEDDEKAFYALLNTSKNFNHVYPANSNDIKELEKYYEKCLEKSLVKKEETKADILNLEAYEILNYSLTDIANMSNEDIEKVNDHVYNFFDIDAKDEEKKDLLDAAISNYKKYNAKLSSGNGYVDILLILAVITTVIMVLAIITFVVL